MKYAISHITTLTYASPVWLAQFAVRLRPVPWPRQTISDYEISVDPRPSSLVEGEGGYLVNETLIALREPIRQVQVKSRFLAKLEPLTDAIREAQGPTIGAVRELALTRPDLSRTSPAAYLFASPMAPAESEIGAWARTVVGEDMPVAEAGRALMHAINAQFEFDSTATLPDTPPIEAFRNKRGVCQDFAHVMIVATRALGIPAAYASGYLRTLPPPGQPRMVGADAMHAWVNIWCGQDLGWIGFDPTNDKLADTSHIQVGMGRDYSDVAPLEGRFRGGAGQSMFFSVDVAPLD